MGPTHAPAKNGSTRNPTLLLEDPISNHSNNNNDANSSINSNSSNHSKNKNNFKDSSHGNHSNSRSNSRTDRYLRKKSKALHVASVEAAPC